jgi:hypothetical protein
MATREIRELIRKVEAQEPRKNVQKFIAQLKEILDRNAPRSLADMTFDEREECRGMWADVYRPEYEYTHQCVIDAPNYDWDNGLSRVLWVGDGFYTPCQEDVTPRFDLKRAWQSDRQPEEKDEE